MVGVAPAYALQGQRHGGRDASPAVQQPRQRDAANAEVGSALRHRPTLRLHAFPDDFAGVSGIETASIVMLMEPLQVFVGDSHC